MPGGEGHSWRKGWPNKGKESETPCSCGLMPGTRAVLPKNKARETEEDPVTPGGLIGQSKLFVIDARAAKSLEGRGRESGLYFKNSHDSKHVLSAFYMLGR